MKLTKPSTGEKVTIKEFFHQWKEGIQKVTPLQQTYSAMFGQVVSMVGVVWGIIFSIIIGYWWMMTILIGGIIVLGTQMIGTMQKLFILKHIDNIMKDTQINNQEVKNV